VLIKIFGVFLLVILVLGLIFTTQNIYANPFFLNGYFTENGIEWCQENLPLYEILGDKFFEHHKHSLESRVCASLYQDFYWIYDGPDRVEKLIERSKHYSQLEILESHEESTTGIIDTTPAGNKDQTLLQGITENGDMIVQIISSSPRINESLEINLSFFDKNSRLISNVNYGIKITQLDQQILENSDIYSENGLTTLLTRPLNSEDPVSIFIIINGIGISENQEELIGPKGEIIMFTVVPEFGEMSIILLGIIITTAVCLSSKSKITLFREV